MSKLTNETKIATQKQAEKIVENHIYTNQTLLVEDCLKANFFTFNDIQNLLLSDDETLEHLQSEGYPLSEITTTMIDDAKTEHTIYEWWLVSE